jgi:hypothetical protein
VTTAASQAGGFASLSCRSSGLVTSPIALMATRVKRRRVELLVSKKNLDDADIGLLLQEMGGKAVPQRMNTDAFGDAGTPRYEANDAVELARTRMLPAVAGKQPGLAEMHPALLARGAPPFAQ